MQKGSLAAFFAYNAKRIIFGIKIEMHYIKLILNNNQLNSFFIIMNSIKLNLLIVYIYYRLIFSLHHPVIARW